MQIAPEATRRADALVRVAENYLASEKATQTGGETRLDDLFLLCRHHHRLVHECSFGVAMTHEGEPGFTDPRGRTLPPVPKTLFRGNVFALMAENRRSGVEISPKTPIPDWYRVRMADQMAVGSMMCYDDYRVNRGI